MSSKRGRRNGKWHKEKKIKRIKAKRDELFNSSRDMDYVALEEPIFAGWDISISLKDEYSNRSDLSYLFKILEAVNLSSFFSRDVNLIKHIRKNNHSFGSLNSYRTYISALDKKLINKRSFDSLPEELKIYFKVDKFYKYSSESNPFYGVDDNYFPWYEFKLKISKSYYYYRGIPNSAAQSEYDKLSNLFLNDIKKLWGGRHRDDFKKGIKGAWRNALKEVVSKQMTEEDLLDYKYPKCWDKREFGWG